MDKQKRLNRAPELQLLRERLQNQIASPLLSGTLVAREIREAKKREQGDEHGPC